MAGMQFGSDEMSPHFKFLNAVQGGQMRDPSAAVGMPVQGSFQQGFTIGNPYVVGAMHGAQPQMYNPSMVGAAPGAMPGRAPIADALSRSMPPPVPMRSMAALQMSQMSQHLAPNMPGMPGAPSAAMMPGAPKPHATPNALAATDPAAMGGAQQFAAAPPWQNGAQEARPTQPEAQSAQTQEEMAA